MRSPCATGGPTSIPHPNMHMPAPPSLRGRAHLHPHLNMLCAPGPLRPPNLNRSAASPRSPTIKKRPPLQSPPDHHGTSSTTQLPTKQQRSPCVPRLSLSLSLTGKQATASAAPSRARLVQIGTRRPADGTDPALHQVNRSRRSDTATDPPPPSPPALLLSTPHAVACLLRVFLFF
jgi:hypothetical protein